MKLVFEKFKDHFTFTNSHHIIIIDGEVANVQTSWRERKQSYELDGQLITSTTKVGECAELATWEQVLMTDECTSLKPIQVIMIYIFSK